jgi:hypothetical protein
MGPAGLRNPGTPQSGLAYLAVLGVVLITSILGLAFVHSVQTHTAISADRNTAMQAQYLAESAAHHAMWRLLYESTSSVEVRVADDYDDATEDEWGGMELDVPHLVMGQEKYSAFRFLNVPLPPGARITSAHVQFGAQHSHSELTNLRIRGVDSDDVVSFKWISYDLSKRPRTEALVTWRDVPAWTGGELYQTPNLATIIQEIVDRPGWTQGSALALLFVSTDLAGSRCIVTHEDSPADAALLRVSYVDPTSVKQTFPEAEDVYYMHELAGGKYGYKVRRHTDTTFATIATVGAVGDVTVHQSYVAYVLPRDPISAGAGPLLYVVRDATSPSSQEGARRILMEEWGYTVTLIDDDAPQGELDTEALANDVVYVSQEVDATSLGTKLVDTATGVVNESRDYIDEFGFSPSANAGGGTPTMGVVPYHYVTSVFEGGKVYPYEALDWYQIASAPFAPGQRAVGSWATAPYEGLPCLMILEAGDEILGGGIAAGRRVQVPMGAGQNLVPVDIANLSDDGRTLIKRSIAWAASSDTPLLFVVSDAIAMTEQECARLELMESWGYQVTPFSEGAAHEDYAAAVSLHDVIYISGETATAFPGEYLRASTVGIVNEAQSLGDELGLFEGAGSSLTTDILIVDDTHYVTSAIGGGAMPLYDGSATAGCLWGTPAPDLRTLGTCSGLIALMTMETDGALVGGGTAAGRRVQVP